MTDAPERIALRWIEGAAITSGPLMDHPDYTRYVRADRIEELEAENAMLKADKAKAVEALEHLVYLQSGNPCTGIQAEKWLGDARTTLAELKGQDDE